MPTLLTTFLSFILFGVQCIEWSYRYKGMLVIAIVRRTVVGYLEELMGTI
jgi:hypothetical protein